MKKMIMVAGIVLAVGMLQAASIKWGVAATGSYIAQQGNTTSGTSAANGLILGETVWLVYGTFSSTLETGDLAALAGSTVKGATILAVSTVGTGIAVAPKKGRVSVTTGYTWGAAAGQYNAGDQFYIVAFDTSTTLLGDTAIKYYGVSAAYTLAAADENSTPDWSAPNFVSNTQVVPEPTSMALLALGAAALGLRRKFRK